MGPKYGSPQDPFYTGKVSMVIDGEWQPVSISENAPHMDWGVTDIPYPASDPALKGTTQLTASTLFIPANAPHKQAAFTFLKYLTSPPVMLKFSLALGNLPARTSLLDNPAFSSIPNFSVWLQALKSPNVHTLASQPYSQQYATDLATALNSALLGSMTPAAALTVWQARPSPMARRDLTARRSRPRRRQLLWGLAFAAPWLIGFAVFFAWPIIASAYYSLTNFNLFQSPQFVGTANYRAMAADPVFWKSLQNTLYLTAVGVPLTLLLSLGCALVLNLPVRGQPLYRALVYLPTIVPIVVTGYLWRWLLSIQYGYVDRVLALMHLPQVDWLEDPRWGTQGVLLVTMWTVGGPTIILWPPEKRTQGAL